MLKHLEEMLAQKDIAGVWDLHVDYMTAYGFDRLIYAFTRFRQHDGFGKLDDMLILSNHDPDYLEVALQPEHFENAPMVKWAARNEGACSWRWVDQQMRAGNLNLLEQRATQLNLRYGIRAGYSIAFPSNGDRSKGAIGLCARKGMRQYEIERIWAEHGREIMVINALTHLRISAMPFATARRPLTNRQREVLEWVADGKTTQDIALRMGLTLTTVEKHLRLAREALDVETTAQEVLKASMQKQIFLGGPRRERQAS